jgi:hypothetical protein
VANNSRALLACLCKKRGLAPLLLVPSTPPEGAGASMRVKCWGQTSGRSRFRLSVNFYKWAQLIDHSRRHAFDLGKLIHRLIRSMCDNLIRA